MVSAPPRALWMMPLFADEDSMNRSDSTARATLADPTLTEERRTPVGRVFSVWAPRASRVDLVLGEEVLPMTADHDRGEGWSSVEAAAVQGTPYGFQLDGGPVLPDPRSLRQPDGPHGRSAVFDPGAFEWTDDSWEGVPLEGAILYEMHVGTFTHEGTFDAAIGRLDHLVGLGVDVVELMPVASFPGRHGWGYDGTCLWAVHEPFGGPRGLQRFVDACHARGLGVCLDVVYNHLGPDGNFLGPFGPYFTQRHQTPWGQAVNLDGPGSDEVREFVLDNVAYWLTDFRMDGLRLDAVHELHDYRAVHILEDIAARARQVGEATGRSRWVVAESDRNDPRTVIPVDQGGLGMDGQWADDVHHGLHVALTGETQGYYADFAAEGALATLLMTPFFHADTWSSFRGRRHGRPVGKEIPGWRFVASLQTHDQVGNRRTGDRHSATLNARRLQCGAALLLTSPYTPMLFMGEEWGASTPWQFFTDHIDSALGDAVSQGRRREFASHGWSAADVPDPQDPATRDRSVLDWAEPGQAGHRELLGWYRALIALRGSRGDLRDGDLRKILVTEDEEGVVVVRRGQHRVAVNLSARHADVDLGLRSTRGIVVLLANDPTLMLRHDGTVLLSPDGAVVVGPASAD
ncbi:MAG: malto-oligosyltrehalose trehalohydrolase [Dermatophilaceae bacterium]